MISNYLKITLRKLYREKLYSLINLAGLSLAIACCLILGLYLKSELTYDQHNEKHERIYRIANDFTFDGDERNYASTSFLVATLMPEEFNEIEEAVTFGRFGWHPLLHQDQAYYWEIYGATENIFDVFDHHIIYGDPDTALVDGSSIAVSESIARRYFGSENPVGKVLHSDLPFPVTIRLVFADLPENSHLKYDALLSMNTDAFFVPRNQNRRRDILWEGGQYNYLLMPADFDIADFEPMQAAFYERNMVSPDYSNYSMRFWLQPLADIHFNSNLQNDQPNGNRAYLYAFAAVALFILIVACINYINLATARSIRYAKEVGMRKILGANKGALMAQFMAEAMVFAFLSMVIGVILVEVLLTFAPVNTLLGKTLSFSLFQEPLLLVSLIGFSLFIGLLTGLYPALYLSTWAPLSALVSSSGAKGNTRLRQGLVLTQFTVTIAVVACTLLMADQMQYLSNKALGFEKENRVSITLVGRDQLRQLPVIKTELLQHPNILGVTTSSGNLGQDIEIWSNSFELESHDGAMVGNILKFIYTDLDYLKVMGIQLNAGRDFSNHLLTDIGTSFIVNESLVKNMGWQEPLGKIIDDGRVIGVVDDFHFQSLHSVIEPFAIIPFSDDWDSMNPGTATYDFRFITANIAGEGIGDTLIFLEEIFATFDPTHPFQFEFVDDSLDALYQSEQQLMKLLGIFSGICIFIACLGLFGLASFTTEQRSKEIGIRKTLGASTSQIILMLSKNMLVLILIGAVIGCTAAYFAIDYWIANFAYRAEMSFAAYLIAALAALVVAYITVALQSYKTAQADPVDALRYE